MQVDKLNKGCEIQDQLKQIKINMEVCNKLSRTLLGLRGMDRYYEKEKVKQAFDKFADAIFVELVKDKQELMDEFKEL